MSHTKFPFDQVRFLEARNGNLVLRGKNGRRDSIYLLPTACRRFSKWYQIFRRWERLGYKSQGEELKLVLENMGSVIQEAVAQRLAGDSDNLGLFPDGSSLPSPPFMAEINAAVAYLKGKQLR